MNQTQAIAYINQLFPKLTETFIYREILAIRERGMPIRLFSVWSPDPATLSAESIPLQQETFYVFPLSWLTLIWLHLRYLVSRPRSYLGGLIFMLTRPGEPLFNRWRSLRHFIYGLPVVDEISRSDIGHIHAHFAGSASNIALMAHRLLGLPFSLTLHSNEIYFERLLLETKIEQADFIVTISEYNRQLLKQLYPETASEQKIHIVHCGLDPQVFTPLEQAKPRTEHNEPFTIIGVGQLVPRKGFHVLIEACQHLVERDIPFQCYIFGEGEERERIENLIAHYNLHDQVKLPGRVYQEVLRQHLGEADVFVLPCVTDKSGDQDGIPVALMEAMAMEIATVSTQVSGIPELIHHADNGILTPPEDPVALADALQHLKDDPEWRRQLGKAGRETVVKAFNIYRSAEQMSVLFEHQILGSSSPVPVNEFASS